MKQQSRLGVSIGVICVCFFSGHLLWEAAGDFAPFLEMAAKHVAPSCSAFYVLAGTLSTHTLLACSHQLGPLELQKMVSSPRLGFPSSSSLSASLWDPIPYFCPPPYLFGIYFSHKVAKKTTASSTISFPRSKCPYLYVLGFQILQQREFFFLPFRDR